MEERKARWRGSGSAARGLRSKMSTAIGRVRKSVMPGGRRAHGDGEDSTSLSVDKLKRRDFRPGANNTTRGPATLPKPKPKEEEVVKDESHE